jgi:hypothetical protein
MNPNFHSKVISVEGGFEIMLCAGFEMQLDEIHGVQSEIGSSTKDLDASGMYLQHSGINDLRNEMRLHYILYR